MDKYLIQLIDKTGAIVDACTYKTEQAFRRAIKSDWATLYDTTARCYNIEDVLNPVLI